MLVRQPSRGHGHSDLEDQEETEDLDGQGATDSADSRTDDRAVTPPLITAASDRSCCCTAAANYGAEPLLSSGQPRCAHCCRCGGLADSSDVHVLHDEVVGFVPPLAPTDEKLAEGLGILGDSVASAVGG